MSYFIIWHQILFTGSAVDNLRGYISDIQFCITSHFSGCLDQISLLLFGVPMIWCLFGIPMIWCLKQSSTLYTLIKNNYNFFALNNGELYTRAPRGTDRSPEYNEQLEKALTDLFNAPPVMYASRIYVTGLVPCLVNAVDFLLYKLHVFRAAVIDPVCTPWNSIFKCISYAKTINITPTLIHLWADLAEKPKRMCRAMITSCLPSLVNMHQSVL